MALFRSVQRVQVLSNKWRVLSRLSSTSSSGDDSTSRTPYWHAETGGKIKEFDEIPGPKPLPIIGHDWRYNPIVGMYDRDKIHHTFSKIHQQYGYVVKESIGTDRTIVHVFHPEDIRVVYMNDGKFPTRMSHRIIARYREERPQLYDSAGLGPSNGEEWRQFRDQFVIKDGAYLVRALPELEQVTDDLVSRVQSGLDKDGEVDVMPMLFRWTLEGVGIATLRRRLGCLDESQNPEADKLIESAKITNDVVYRTEMMATGHEEQYQRLVPAEDYFASVIRKHLDKAMADLPQRDNPFLQTILAKEDIKINDLYTFVLDLFHAGIHTTAVTTAFALYHLSLNKNVQDKLRSQLLKVLPSKDTRYVDSDANKNDFLFCVVRETLRLNPPVIGNGRVLQAPLVLGGYRIPEGTMVLLHHQVASLQDSNFGDALKFRPERFEQAAGRKFNHYASMPFGYGHRQCVGQALAREEIKMALSKFIRNFEVSYHHDKIDTVNRLHNEPDKPVMVRFKALN